MDVNVDRTSPTVMVVSWTPLGYVEARGFISHYTVAYSPQTSDGRKRQATGQTIDVPGMDSSTVTINDLDPETGYSVLVSGTTEGGLVGEMSVPVTNPAPESKLHICCMVQDKHYSVPPPPNQEKNSKWD